jgi:hypothetical protein
MADIMKQTTATMGTNADKFDAAREQQLQKDSADARAKYDQQMAANGKNGKSAAPGQDSAPVTMQYKTPDTGSSTPARTFSIE